MYRWAQLGLAPLLVAVAASAGPLCTEAQKLLTSGAGAQSFDGSRVSIANDVALVTAKRFTSSD